MGMIVLCTRFAAPHINRLRQISGCLYAWPRADEPADFVAPHVCLERCRAPSVWSLHYPEQLLAGMGALKCHLNFLMDAAMIIMIIPAFLLNGSHGITIIPPSCLVKPLLVPSFLPGRYTPRHCRASSASLYVSCNHQFWFLGQTFGLHWSTAYSCAW